MKRRKLLFALVFALSLVFALCGAACSEDITLSFETNGGTPAAEIVTVKGAEVDLPKTTKPGYAFDGWYAKSDLSGEGYSGKITAPEKSTKYYAKWVTGYEVKLETDGGALTTTSVWVKEGGSVLEAVRDLVPQKSGLSFGAWFLGDAELSSSYRMPTETVTLTAKYKAEYIIQLYLQNLSGTSYQRADEYETVGSGYVNTSVSPEPPAVHGYSVQPNPQDRTPVTTLTLSTDLEKNLYSFYYDRNTYSVFYDGNPPAGTDLTGDTPYDSALFGSEMVARANGFAVEGYRFAGWAERTDGEVVYQPGAKFILRDGTNLYAIWDRGYSDRLGSEDLIFFPRTDENKAVLLRNGMEFWGTREGNAFSFTTDAGETFSGSVVGDRFSYERKDLIGTYVYYDNYPRPVGEDYPEEERYDRTRTLEVDGYLGATYTQGGVKKSGSLAFAPDQGDYLFTSDDGTTSFHTIFMTSPSGNEKIFAVGGGEFGYYVNSRGEELLLDGYGTAFLVITTSAGTSQLQGYYYLEKADVQYAFGQLKSYKVVCFINDTNNLLQNGQGWNTFYLCVLPDYWESLDAEYGLYYIADTARGTYENGQETLILDGHGYYTDSAVYTDKDGNELKGGYVYEVDFVTGTVINLVDMDGKTLKSFTISADGSFAVYNGPEVEYTEYYLLEDDSMQPVLLAIFEEEAKDVKGSKRAEFYAYNSRNVGVHAASGYVTSAPVQQGSDILLYTFTRTSAEYGFEDSMPKSMKFTVTSMSPNDTVWYDCYSVLEENGETNYDVIELSDGGTVWANRTVTADGEGSLYFKDGKVSFCSFPISTDEYFNETYGELLDSGAGGGEGRLFKLTASAKEGVRYEATPAEGLPTTFYYFDPTLSPENGPFENLVLTPDFKACYDEGNNGSWADKGTYREKTGETTIFGFPIYELVFANAVRFEFVRGNLYFLGNSYPAYFRKVGEGRAYSSESGTLTLDGYGTARYTADDGTFSGSYYHMTAQIVRVTSTDGTQREFEIASDGTFTALDDCYGTWDLVDGNYYPFAGLPRIFFDGKASFTITQDYGHGNSTQGRYELHDAEFGEYVLYNAKIGGKTGNYYVRFMEMVEYGNYNCVVRDNAAGLYVDENYSVLSLNGFGSGSIKGSRYDSTGNFEMIDEEAGFGEFMFTTANTAYEDEIVHLLLDYENGTFRILENEDYYYNYIYFTPEFDHVAFREDGAVFLGNLLNGAYLITESGVNAYFYNQETYSYDKVSLPAPGGNTYAYNNQTYYRYDGDTFTAEGTIVFLDADGHTAAEKAATLSFGIRYRSIVGFETTFEIEGEEKEYGGFALYTYTERKVDPRLENSGIVYNIDFNRTANGKWTFAVTDAGYRKFLRDDRNDAYGDGPAQSGAVYHQGGRITFTYNGFGDYELSETLYDGRFLYFYNEDLADKGIIEFKGVKEPRHEFRRLSRTPRDRL